MTTTNIETPLKQNNEDVFVFPVSFAQKRLWFLQQFQPENYIYNEYGLFNCRGKLNIIALEQSLNEVIRRHEVFRTYFTIEKEEPIQVILPSLTLELPVTDLCSISENEREVKVKQLIEKETQKPFDLTQVPLIRFSLLQLTENEYILIFVVHHIISDGWSSGLFFKEIEALYEAFCNNQPSPLPELPIQYADFAVWQRQHLSGEILETQINYWKENLADAPELLQLPTDRPRPTVQTYQGNTQSWTLDTELTEKLQAISRKNGATLFMTLLAAFATLLYRYSSQSDILIGSPIANRNRSEIESLIGFFVNTLVLRTGFVDNPSFEELLAQVRETTLKAYQYQDVPFEQVVEALQPERSLSYSPLFQVMFILQNAPMSDVELPDVNLSLIKQQNTTAKFDLTLDVTETELGLVGKWEYNTDLFDGSTIERMTAHFQNLLSAIVENPAQKVSELPMLSAAEHHQLLNKWNQTYTDYPRDKCIHQLFEEQVKRTPDALALVFDNEQLTYRQLNQKANQLAHYLRSLEVSSGVLVGISVEPSLEQVVSILGVLKAGGVYVPLDPNYPQERLTFMQEDSQVQVVLTQEALLEKISLQNSHVICLDRDRDTINRESSENLASTTTPDDLAYAIYTSGSTGKPKAVMGRIRSTVNRLHWMWEMLPLAADEICCQKTSINFVDHVAEIFSPLLKGIPLVIVADDIRSDIPQLMSLLGAQKITRIVLVPSLLKAMLESAPEELTKLRYLKYVFCSGETLPLNLAQAFQEKISSARLFNLYGSSEVAADVTWFEVNLWQTRQKILEYFQPLREEYLKKNTIPIGKPIANTQIYILDKYGNLVPPGITGELYVGGDGVAKGYLSHPELTEEKFIVNPLTKDKTSENPEADRLYKTGDLARWLPDGNIELVGRIDNQVKIRGFRIELGEIESLLNTHPQIKQAVVIATEDINSNKRLVAYLVSSNRSLSTIQVREFLQQKLPEYMIPSAFVLLEALPLNPNGKIDRKALPAPDIDLANSSEYIPPQTPTQEVLANIFSGVLGINSVGIHDNFFSLGGHSLLATQVISRIRQSFATEISLKTLFEFPTVAQLDQNLKQLTQNSTKLEIPTIQPIPRNKQPLALSWAQERLWFLNQLEGASSTYNIPGAYRVSGNLDIDSLQLTLSEIVRRHEVLRTSFPTQNSKPTQVINPQTTININIVDLQELEPTERETIVLQEVQKEAVTPFNLEANLPLIRCSLLQLSTTEYVFLLTMHHIVSDGWSIGVLIQELSSLYQAFTKGEASPLPELPIQYADFAVWQRQYLSGEILETQLNYWKENLADAPELLQLPTDRPRPTVQTYQGTTQSWTIETELTEKLQAISRKNGATLFMTLLAAFATLLYRYSGQSDILIGSPIANRNRSEIESLIGFFVNTLVLRTGFVDNPSFEELLAQVRETTLKAYQYQDVPFEQVVEALQPQRSLSYSPIFQVMFILQNAPMSDVELPDVNLSLIKQQNTTAKFDLTLDVTETESGLVGKWEYNTDLFDSSTIERMAGHFQNLLSAIVENPAQKVSELPILSAAEHHQLLNKWNQTYTDYPRDKCIHQLFEEQVKRTPDAVAVVFDNQQLTYQQLNQQANQLAHYLRSLEIGSGVLVGISIEPSPEMVVSLLSVLKAGGVYVPLDPNYPQERLAFMQEDSQVEVVLTQEPLLEKISLPNSHAICLDRDRDAIDRESNENLACTTTPDDLAYAIYTSGSTGKPKAVLGYIRSTVNRLHWMWETLPFTADEICCQKTSINFVDHVAETFSPLLKGIPLAIVRNDIRSDVPQLMNLLREQKITRIVLVPSLLKAILEYGSEQLTQFRYLKYVFCSGETLPLNLVHAFQEKISSARLFNIYGSSEVAADVTCFEVNPWQTRQKILEYFKPQVIHKVNKNQVSGFEHKPFTQPDVSIETLAPKFQQSELPLYPLKVEDYYDKLSQEVLPYVIDTGSPKFIGHMTSALPDFMHDMSKLISQLNQNLVKIETSKSLIFLEREALAILHRLVYNFADEFYQENIQQKNRNLGIVTTGGTTANISALLCARNRGLLREENSQELLKESIYKVLSKKGYEDVAIVGSRLMHYSINKATSILGLGTKNVVYIDSGSDGKLDLDLLVEKIRECRQKNLYIMAIVGIAGTTETGEIDPLVEMGNIAQEFGIHFHVDGAWGGATMFSERHKGKLKGIEKADTITICGHKQLYLPQGISVCLFKDPQMLDFAETTARYQSQRDTFDVGRFTIEGSRSALSLCLHGALHIIGKRGYEILIDDGIEKAQYFSKLISMLEAFELIMEPVLNIVNYRYIPADLRAKVKQKSLSDDEIERIDRLNTQIQKEQFERGMTFVSKTTLIDTSYGKGKQIVVFRTVLSNPNTTTADLHSVLEDQLRIANQIETRNKQQFNGVKNIPEPTIPLDQEMIYLRLADDPKANLEAALEEYLKKNTVPIGKPISNTQIYILDKYGNLVPPGITGDLYVGGEGLAKGYLNQPELTQEKFILNPFTKNNKSQNPEADRLYKTGDLARWLPDGNIEFVGRIDNQVKLRGIRIELGEIEALLNGNSQIKQAVVIVREDVPGNKRLVAYIVASDESLSTKELRELTKEKLPEYMVPSAFVTLDSLPLMPNGKIDRKALPAPDIDLTSSNEYVPPQTPTQEIIANIFAEVLGVTQVGIHDNFFDLGGHSLLATQVISRIRQYLEVEIPLKNVFEFPTVAQLEQNFKQLTESSTKIHRPAIQPIPNKVEPLPLSWAQERLWFIDQLEGGSTTYSDCGVLRITGNLNYDALNSAILEIIRRHEVLRTRFEAIEGTPVQIIEPDVNFQLEINDWQHLSPTQQDTDLQKYAQQEAATPLNLSAGHLLRVTLLKFSATESILLVTMHHIITDGWSNGIFIKEFCTLYNAYSQGEISTLTELPLQYGDYSVWQRQWLRGEVLENLLSYWKQQLAGAASTLELPFKKKKGGVTTGESQVESFTISPTIAEKLQTLGRQEGVTLFMTLLATLQILLGRYTNSEDIVVGTDIANRNQGETESLIGFFVNLLVLRTNLSGNPTFKELLKRVQEVTLGAYAHQDLPFAKLVDILRPERKASTTPLFQVLFVMQNTPISKLELPNLTIEPLPIDNGETRFDLAIFVQEAEAGIIWNLKYSTDLFDQQDIVKMSGNLQTLLTNITDNPDTKIQDLEMLTESEKEAQVAAKAKRTKANFKKFKSIKPKAVSLPEKDLIKTSYLQPEQTLPLVIEPNSEEVDIADWARNNREFFESNLRQHGAILFKDFHINSVSEFENVAGAITPSLFGEYGDLPREGVSKKVYGSTPYPEDKAILFHNESSHLHRWPQKIFFLCVKAAESGGETPIVDCRKVYQMLSPQLREKLEEKQLMYVRNYVEDLDVSWQDFFHTNNKSEVESYCKNAGMEFEWLENNGLKTAKLRPAITTHPKTGEKIFFNQIQLHHISYLDAAVRESLLSEFGEKSLPRNVYYGDGSPIEDSVIEEIGAIYEQAAISFPWQAGNMIMLDNMLIAHGRNPYIGERKIVVAMGELMEESED